MDDAPPAGAENHDARIDALAAQAKALNAGVAELMGETGKSMVDLARRGRSARRWITLIGSSLLFDVLLTVGLGYVADHDHKLAANTRTQLCGVLQLLVNADTPAANALAKSRGDDMATRAASFASIHRSYAALDCASVVKP